MSKHKKYEIETFEQLCNVSSAENIDNLSIGFAKWLILYTAYVDEIRERNPKETNGKSNWQITKSTFIWIDDGKSELKAVKIKRKDTGEITNLKIKS